MYISRICPRGSVGVSHILGFGVCTVMGVTGGHAPWDAKSGVDRLFVSLASMYLIIKISIISSFKYSRFILSSSRLSATYFYKIVTGNVSLCSRGSSHYGSKLTCFQYIYEMG